MALLSLRSWTSFRRMKVWQKCALIAVPFVLPVAALLYLVLSQNNKDIGVRNSVTSAGGSFGGVTVQAAVGLSENGATDVHAPFCRLPPSLRQKPFFALVDFKSKNAPRP